MGGKIIIPEIVKKKSERTAEGNYNCICRFLFCKKKRKKKMLLDMKNRRNSVTIKR